MKPSLFVGLGNPGERYRMTRHNVGFMVLDEIAELLGISFKEEARFNALVAKGAYLGEKVVLAKPLTFMNASGEAVQRLLHFNKWWAESLLVVSDDVALPFGSMRLRLQGSDGGHNGLKSIAHHLGTNQYIRLRMGVGNPDLQGQMDMADFVLAPFAQSERAELESFIKRGRDAALKMASEDPILAMNQINQRTPSVKAEGEEKLNA